MDDAAAHARHPHQQVITRDNVPVAVDGVIFFMVKDTERAVVTVQDYRAISQYAKAAPGTSSAA